MSDGIEVPLTNGGLALVDELDADLVLSHIWRGVRRTYTSYAVGPAGYMHRLITEFRWAEVDHINGDGLDNRRHNLREADRVRQMWNRRKPARSYTGEPTSSTYKGVDLHKASGRWRVRIADGTGRVRALGYYSDEREAALVYDSSARQIHGPYATVNFPRPGERGAL